MDMRYPNSWLVYFKQHPKIKWMKTGGTPILGNLHISKMNGGLSQSTGIKQWLKADFLVNHEKDSQKLSGNIT
jgi:hypothetical protein